MTTYQTLEEMLTAAQAGEPIAFEELRRWEANTQYERLRAAMLRFGEGQRDWDDLSHMMGSHERPRLLSLIWGSLSPDVLLEALRDAWVYCDAPEKAMRRREWLPVFRRAGYHDSNGASTPPDRVTLWRGGVRRTGMSWTGDRERAVWFQRRWESLGSAHLWTATIQSERLLAHYAHRDEDEYVVDTTGLRPRLAT